MVWEAGGLGEETEKQMKDISSPSSLESRRRTGRRTAERERATPKGLNGSQTAVTAFRVWSRGLASGSEIGRK